MTKASANPRRYSKGPEGLDENQNLQVYMALFVQPGELEATSGRLDYLADKHEAAVIDYYAKELGSYEDAVEHVQFNIVGAYVGKHTPCFLSRLTKDEQALLFPDPSTSPHHD